MARAKGARRVTCAHKANIMKITDGLFLETFYKIAKQEFPDVKVDDAIIDDMAMKLVSRPDAFDMVVLPNLQGDILSDLCAGLVGGLGLAPSANIGDHISIFEAVHGTAPDIAGKNLANPTALLLSGLTMLRHLDMNSKAKRIEEGLLTTLNLGFRTRDVASAADKVVSTSQFADEIIKNMPNEVPEDPKTASAAKPFVPPSVPKNHIMMKTPRDISKETVVGVDIFVDTSLTPNELAPLLQKSIGNTPVSLIMLSNRGTQVWPSGSLFTECVNHYRARFQTKNNAPIAPNELLQLAARVNDVAGNVSVARVCSLEMLLKIGDKLGFTLAQGQ
jgi:isocitrate dehydrogenase